jgi:hypothetical protein
MVNTRHDHIYISTWPLASVTNYANADGDGKPEKWSTRLMSLRTVPTGRWRRARKCCGATVYVAIRSSQESGDAREPAWESSQRCKVEVEERKVEVSRHFIGATLFV